MIKIKLKSEKLIGGSGDFKPDSFFNQAELKAGVQHELEHTKDQASAKEIAKDHLSEDPKYYSKLKASGLNEFMKNMEEEKSLFNMPTNFSTGKKNKTKKSFKSLTAKKGSGILKSIEDKAKKYKKQAGKDAAITASAAPLEENKMNLDKRAVRRLILEEIGKKQIEKEKLEEVGGLKAAALAAALALPGAAKADVPDWLKGIMPGGGKAAVTAKSEQQSPVDVANSFFEVDREDIFKRMIKTEPEAVKKAFAEGELAPYEKVQGITKDSTSRPDFIAFKYVDGEGVPSFEILPNKEKKYLSEFGYKFDYEKIGARGGFKTHYGVTQSGMNEIKAFQTKLSAAFSKVDTLVADVSAALKGMKTEEQSNGVMKVSVDLKPFFAKYPEFKSVMNVPTSRGSIRKFLEGKMQARIKKALSGQDFSLQTMQHPGDDPDSIIYRVGGTGKPAGGNTAVKENKITKDYLRKIIHESMCDMKAQGYFGGMSGAPVSMPTGMKPDMKPGMEPKKASSYDIDPDGYEGRMAKGNLFKMAQYSAKLHNMIEDNENLEPWVEEKIAVAASMIETVAHYLEYEKMRG